MSKWNLQLKDWVDYRFQEMEEKAGVTEVILPEYDMDGCRFVEPDDWETEIRNDAYVASISQRLTHHCLDIGPYGF